MIAGNGAAENGSGVPVHKSSTATALESILCAVSPLGWLICRTTDPVC